MLSLFHSRFESRSHNHLKLYPIHKYLADPVTGNSEEYGFDAGEHTKHFYSTSFNSDFEREHTLGDTLNVQICFFIQSKCMLVERIVSELRISNMGKVILCTLCS
jgi:hypothetical protein